MKPRLRKLWLVVHRWIGLTVGLLFVLLGLTGSVLVFDHAIDEWLYPELLLSAEDGPQRPFEEILTAAEGAFPGESRRAVSVSNPRVPGGVCVAWFQTGTEDAPEWTQVLVDPATARVTGRRVWGEDPLSWIYKLHYTLHGGDAGETVVGIGGLVLMLSVGSGIYLWWPLWRNGWRAAFAVRGGKRFVFDLHKTIGVASGAVLLVVAFTGVAMTFPDWVKPVVTVFSPETPPPEDLESSHANSDRRLAVAEAVAVAEREFPDATFDHFHPPHEGVYEVGLRQPGEVTRSFGRTQLWIDAHSGEVLAVREPGAFTAADTFFAWQFPLHNGEAFGLVGRWIVFVTGLVPAVLYVTGFVLWRRRRPRRRSERGEATAVVRSPEKPVRGVRTRNVSIEDEAPAVTQEHAS